MNIQYKILGYPQKDNAVFAELNTGNKIYKFLFDCGEGVLKTLSFSDIRKIDYIFFSHFHLDHAAGFDYFFRRNYDRYEKPVRIFGPEGTIDIIHHRLRGFTWNLNSGLPGEWIVTELHHDKIMEALFSPGDGFTEKRNLITKPITDCTVDTEFFRVTFRLFDHIIPSCGYTLEAKERLNINKEKLENSGLTPGGWLSLIKSSEYTASTINIDDKKYSTEELRKNLLQTEPGEKLSYLTDLIYNETNLQNAIKLTSGADVLICEAQYNSRHPAEAAKNYHLTSRHSAKIAELSGVKKMILFHLSDRYSKEELKLTLEEAREIFPESYFPDNWQI